MKTILTTCEHSGNTIPSSYKHLFKEYTNLLKSHRGYDIGALELYEYMVNELSDMHVCYGITRLLIDPNRSLQNRSLFSEVTKCLDKNNKQYIIDTFYNTYRNGVQTLITMSNKNRTPVTHISVHTFTPELNDKKRTADIGLLYDTKHPVEKELCTSIRDHINRIAPELQVRLNYPYRGVSDGFVSYLRKHFDQAQYTGIELEVNQRFVLTDKELWKDVQGTIIKAFRAVLLDSGI